MRGNIPVQAKANGLQLHPIPPEVSNLNLLEIRLISLRVPFMKMVALPSGKQRCIHGPAVNVPSKFDSICTMLPRLPSQTELIPLKFKRKLVYKGHYMYDYISPEKLMIALRWLKENNHLYADVEINDAWLEESLANDEDLCTSLVEQPPADNDEVYDINSTELSTQEPITCNATHCIDMECEMTSSTTQETMGDTNHSHMPCLSISVPNGDDDFRRASNTLTTITRENGFIIHDVPYDGDCLFSAITYQLKSIGLHSGDKSELRKMVADHLDANSAFYCNYVSLPMMPIMLIQRPLMLRMPTLLQ